MPPVRVHRGLACRRLSVRFLLAALVVISLVLWLSGADTDAARAPSLSRLAARKSSFGGSSSSSSGSSSTSVHRPNGAVAAGPGVTLLLQLSDLHISHFSHTPPPPGVNASAVDSRVVDMEALADELLSLWRPDAVVITGDLTDAKAPSGRGQQQEAEWQDYARVRRRIMAAAGVREDQVFDVRGNHDTFDTIRGGAEDHYMTHSARAARGSSGNGSAACSGTSGTSGGDSAPWGAPGSALDRVFLDPVIPQASPRYRVACAESAAAGAPGGVGARGAFSCPPVVLLGVDAAPSPGLRGPTNFIGPVGPDLLAAVDSRLEQLHTGLQAAGCPPPSVIAYGHYPLTTLGYGSAPVMPQQQQQQQEQTQAAEGHGQQQQEEAAEGRELQQRFDNGQEGPDGQREVDGSVAERQQRQQQAVEGRELQGMWQARDQQQQPLPRRRGCQERWRRRQQRQQQRLEGVLGRWDAAAYLSGHLHDVFGLRLHRMHAKPDGQGYLAELELADWKINRLLRLITVDTGSAEAPGAGGFSFADLRFVRPDPGSGDGPRLLPVDHSRGVDQHLVLITSPPDARYSPLPSNTSAPGARPTAVVRALVLPMRAAGSNRQAAGQSDWWSDGGAQVSAVWGCQAAADAADHQGSSRARPDLQPPPQQQQLNGSVVMTASASQAWVFEADLGQRSTDNPLARCSGVVHLQVVVVEAGSGRQSRSELRPVLTPMEPQARQQQPLPLGLRLSEVVVLSVDWASFGRAAFLAQWLLLCCGLLLLPRLAAPTICGAHAAVACTWRPATSPTGATSQGATSPTISSTAAAAEAADAEPDGTPSQAAAARAACSPRYGHSHGHVQAAAEAAARGDPADRRPDASACGPAGNGRCFGRAALAAVVAAPLLLVLQPLRDVSRLATSHPPLWWALLAFAANLMVGPWWLATFNTSLGGWGVATAHGLLLPRQHMDGSSAGYVFVESHDVSIVTNLHMGTCVLPAVLWLAAVASSWCEQQLSLSAAAISALQPAGSVAAAAVMAPAHWRLLTWRQAAALLVLLSMHAKLQARLAVSYGPAAVLLAPATGWVVPLAAAWLWLAHRRIFKQRRD